MKKHFIKILLTVTLLLVGSFAAVNAQGNPNPTPAGNTAGQTVQPTTGQALNNNQNTSNQNNNDEKNSLSFFGFSFTYTIQLKLLNWILHSVLSIVGYILALTAGLLDIVIYTTILNMKDVVDKLPVLDNIIIVFRDIISLTFIYFLLKGAIQLILGIGKGPNWKELLTRIVVVMILINFSPVLTRLMIDASNLATITFYRQIPGVGANDAFNSRIGDPLLGNGNNVGWADKKTLSSTIMGRLKLSSILSPQLSPEGEALANQAKLPKNDSVATEMTTAISLSMSIVLVLIIATIYLTAAVMLLYRFFLLLLLLLTSPLMFIGWATPDIGKGNIFKEYSDKWWGALKSNLLYAPVFMFLLWMGITIMMSDGFQVVFSPGNLTWVDTFTAPFGAAMKLVVNYAMVVGFLLAAIIAPAKLGADTKTAAIADFTKRQLVGAKDYLYSTGANNTIGRFMNFASEKFEGTRFSKTSRVGADISAGLKSLSGTKFGGQSYKEYTKEQEGYAKAGKEFDKKGQISELVNVVSSSTATESDRTTLLNQVKGMSGKSLLGLGKEDGKLVVLKPEIFSLLTDNQIDQLTQAMEDGDKEKVNEARTVEVKAALSTAQSKINTPEESAAIDALRSVLANTSNKSLAALDSETIKNPLLVQNLKEKQFKAVMESGFSQKIKNQLSDTRTKGFMDALINAKSPEELEKAVAGLSPEEIAQIDPEKVLTDDETRPGSKKISPNFGKIINSKLLAAIAKEGKFDFGTLDLIKEFLENEQRLKINGEKISRRNEDAITWLEKSPQAHNYFA